METQTKVLILGGTGIIGNELCRVCIKQGFEIYVISRGNRRFVPNVNSIAVDIHDKEGFTSAIKDYKFDAVIDLLSFNSRQLTQTVSAVMERASQYIFVSSATIYQGVKAGSSISEESPLISSGWNYPVDKIHAENQLIKLCHEINLPYTILRPYITYSEQRIAFGEWEYEDIAERIRNERPIPISREVASARTTLTHSQDLAEGICGLVGNKLAFNNDYIITSEESYTWREVFELTAKLLGKELQLVEMPAKEIQQLFPELSGKISDRCLNREFDNSKIKLAVPRLSITRSLRVGYSGAMKGMGVDSTNLNNYISQGKMGRLITSHSKSNLSADAKYLSKLLLISPIRFIKYMIGYNQYLYLLYTFTKKLLGLNTSL